MENDNMRIKRKPTIYLILASIAMAADGKEGPQVLDDMAKELEKHDGEAFPEVRRKVTEIIVEGLEGIGGADDRGTHIAHTLLLVHSVVFATLRPVMKMDPGIGAAARDVAMDAIFMAGLQTDPMAGLFQELTDIIGQAGKSDDE